MAVTFYILRFTFHGYHMLDISISIQGDKVLIAGLDKLAHDGIPRAIDRGLNRIAKGIHRSAYDFLSGPGSKQSIKKGGAYAGGYPVPVRTGNLRRLLDWLKPGESKTGPAGTFTAGAHEVVIYDSAEYANVIHEGTGSSAKFGRRPYLTGALDFFNQGDRIKKTVEEEIQKEIDRR